MTLTVGRGLCLLAAFLFAIDAVGSAVGLTVTSRETVLAIGLCSFALGHVI